MGQSSYLRIISTGMQYGFDQNVIRCSAKPKTINHYIGESAN